MKPFIIFRYLPIIGILFFQLPAAFAQNENISEGAVFDGEPFMAVDPYDAHHIVVVWMGFDGIEYIKIKERVSFDGGNTWSSIIEIPHNFTGYTSADPSMDFDSEGRIYLCMIDYHPMGITGGVYVYRSDDGGLTWNAPTLAIDNFADGSEIPVDRPWMVIDRSGGINDGNIYITTKPAPWVPFPNRNYFIASTDGGETFSDWRYIDTTGWSIGDFIQAPMATPAVAADGKFYCIYPSFEITEFLFPRFIVASSANAGNDFNYAMVISGIPGITDTLGKYGYLLKTDPTNALHLTFIYFWSPYDDTDIYSVESMNGGATWSAPVRVNNDPINNHVLQDLVWGGFDTDGDLLITWRDRRNAPDTGYITSYEIWGTVLWKDSASFSPDFKISEAPAPFNDVLYDNGNDFMCSALANDTIYAVWGDTRDGTLDIWFNKISAHTLTGTGIQHLAAETPSVKIFPVPAENTLFFEGENISRIRITDIAGNIVKEIHNPMQHYIDISTLLPGNYIIEFAKEGKIFTEKFVKN